MAIIKNPSGTFTAVYYVNRRPRQETFLTYKNAELFLMKKTLERESRVIHGPTNEAGLDELIEDYLAEVKKSKASQERDRYILPKLKAWLLKYGVTTVNHINKDIISRYDSYRTKSVSQRTVNIEIRLLSAILNHAWKNDRIASNPIGNYKYKADEKPFPRWLTAQEINAILEKAKEYDCFPIFYAFLTCGLRLTEATYLQGSNIEGNLIHIKGKVVNGEAWNPKWNRERWIELGKDYLDDKYLLKYLKSVNNDAFCFTHRHYQDSRKYPERTVQKLFKTILRSAKIRNIEEISVHTLRHTHVSYAVARVGLDKRFSLRTIMENVGIGDYETLLRYSQAVRGLTENLPHPKRFPWQI